LGWNRVTPTAGASLLRPGHAWFANSYCLPTLPEGRAGALVTHGSTFVAALESAGLLACQFHPELSGRWGEELLRRWVEATSC
jgi:imidazoleglycerol phosphate synthase glutamine amidotransferase subunit HisH